MDSAYDAVITINSKDTKCEGALGVSSGLYILKSGSAVQAEAKDKKVDYIVSNTSKPTLSSTSKGKLTVDIKKVSGAYNADGLNVVNKVTGYQIKISSNEDMSNAKSFNSKSLSKTLTGLKSGKTYYVQVRGYIKNYRDEKAYNNYSSVVSIKIK